MFRNPRTKNAPDVLTLLAKFKSIDIFIVDSIESTYTLEDHTHMGREEIAVEQGTDSILVLIDEDFIRNRTSSSAKNWRYYWTLTCPHFS